MIVPAEKVKQFSGVSAKLVPTDTIVHHSMAHTTRNSFGSCIEDGYKYKR